MARAIRGRKYRSKLEASVAKKAQSSKIKIKYESFGIPWVQPEKDRTYNPDFILENNIIIEVKGHFVLKDRQKMLWVKEQWPLLDIRFVFKENGWLTKKHKHRYSDWCDKHGFQYSVGRIPKKWAKEPNKILPETMRD